jgi:hypothetical protein
MRSYRHLESSSVALSAPCLRRNIAVGLILFLATPFWGSVPTFAQQATPASQPAGPVSSSQPAAQDADTGTEKPAADARPVQNSNQQPNAPKAAPGQQEGGAQAPLGTAVAPYERGVGVAASRPAGAVIAPAKQRRTRSFVIKLSVLIGAGIAVGTVVALSNASPSRPH